MIAMSLPGLSVAPTHDTRNASDANEHGGRDDPSGTTSPEECHLAVTDWRVDAC